ncbi:MAG: transcription termination/antitermination protein NusG [Candidatus Eisenbacteria bacterium]
MDKKWYVVHTYSGHENKVKTVLERAITAQSLEGKVARVVIPTENVTEMRNGKRTVTTRKFFPSYILVEMEMDDETLHLVTNTPGVSRIVGVGTQPTPLREDEVARILDAIDTRKAKPTPEIPYKIGEHVRVCDGPFNDFTGVVDEVNPERGKLKVMVSIFGRATPVELDFLQVKNI